VSKIRVLVADDHPTFREGLCRLLGTEEDIEIVGQAANGEEAVRLVIELTPDVAIIDIAMPLVDGIEAARQIKEAGSTTAIMMVSAYDYESYLIGSLQAGAAGYLPKSVPVSELIGAVRLVRSQEAVFDLKGIRCLLDHMSGNGNNGELTTRLRQREMEILRKVAKG
jgi:DNA-binding NarL/FixJ family response regulator